MNTKNKYFKLRTQQQQAYIHTHTKAKHLTDDIRSGRRKKCKKKQMHNIRIRENLNEN